MLFLNKAKINVLGTDITALPHQGIPAAQGGRKPPPIARLKPESLAKINYRLHTDAIQTHLIPVEVTPKQAAFTYASEADLLNVALFGQTAREWRDN